MYNSRYKRSNKNIELLKKVFGASKKNGRISNYYFFHFLMFFLSRIYDFNFQTLTMISHRTI